MIRGVSVVPVESLHAGAGAGETGSGVEAQLAEPLAAIDAPAHAAGMDVSHGEAGAQHRLVIHTISHPNARAQVQVMGPDGVVAVTAERSAACKFQGTQMPARSRIRREWVEERHTIGHFFEGAPDIPAQPQIHRQPRTYFNVVLNIRSVIFVASTGLCHGVLSYTTAVHRTQKIGRVGVTRVTEQ